ncbi:hypothetical protein ACVGV8_00955, partial [Enterobacter intestinihominis]
GVAATRRCSQNGNYTGISTTHTTITTTVNGTPISRSRWMRSVRIHRCSFSTSGAALAGPTDNVGRVSRSRHPAMFSDRE